jgi:Co/Zn/Cd efflux system component
MKPLEDRRWFVLTTLFLSFVIMFGLWRLADLSIMASTVHLYVFSALGIFLAVNRLVALLLIKARPALGEIA